MISTGDCDLWSATQIGGGPTFPTVQCDDSDDSVIEVSYKMPEGWDGTAITFGLDYVQTATDTYGVKWAVKGQCCATGEAIDGVYGSAASIQEDNVNGSSVKNSTWSSSFNPSGTCDGLDTVTLLVTLDEDETQTDMTGLHILSGTMEYTWIDDDNFTTTVPPPDPIDFTSDIGIGGDCLGAWLIGDTETEHETDNCAVAGQSGADDMTWNGGVATWTAATPPVGTASGQSAVVIQSGGRYDFTMADDDDFDAVDLTAIGWIYVTDADPAVFFSKRDGESWELRTNGAQFTGEVDDAFEASAVDSMAINTWTHVALRFDGTAGTTNKDEIEIFINGVDVCQAGCSATAGDPAGNALGIAIGTDEDFDADLDGRMMEVLWFSGLVSDIQIKEMFLCGAQGDADGTARDTAYTGATCTDINNKCCD